MSTNGEVLDDTLVPLRELLKQPHDDDGDGGDNGNNGNNGGGSGRGDDGEGFNRLVRILQEGLARVGERQSDFTAKLVEAAFARVMETLTAQVKDLADTIMKAAVQGDEAVAKQLGAAVTTSISKNADVAEHVVKLAKRVHTLEAQVARLALRLDEATAGEKGALR
jgi:hypothetical protein